MFKWLFNRCEHDYKIIKETYEPYYDDGLGKVVMWRGYILYCPKCDKEKKVEANRYDLEREKQRIKARYNG